MHIWCSAQEILQYMYLPFIFVNIGILFVLHSWDIASVQLLPVLISVDKTSVNARASEMHLAQM